MVVYLGISAFLGNSRGNVRSIVFEVGEGYVDSI